MLVQASSLVWPALLSPAFFSPLLCLPFPCALRFLTLLAVRLTRNYQTLFMGEGGADMCSNSQCASLKTVQALCSFKIRQNKSLILLDRLFLR